LLGSILSATAAGLDPAPELIRLEVVDGELDDRLASLPL